MAKNKIKKIPELKKILVRLKQNGKIIVFTNGCFDILHRGHISLLQKSKSFGDVLIVALNSDESVKKIKGPRRPINTLLDRSKILAALEVVDYVTSFSQTNPANIIKQVKPDVLVKGGDWKASQVIGKDFVESYGGKVKIVPYVDGYSTKSLIRRLSSKES